MGNGGKRQPGGFRAKQAADAAKARTAEGGQQPAPALSTAFTPGAAQNFIREGEVAAWTADGAPGVPKIGYHAAPAERHTSILRDGINPGRGKVGSVGAGFYMYDAHETSGQYGEHEVRVAIRLTNPLKFASWDKAEAYMDRLSGQPPTPDFWTRASHAEQQTYLAETAQRTRATLIARGYDGIVVRNRSSQVDLSHEPGKHMIVALVPSAVRVIRES